MPPIATTVVLHRSRVPSVDSSFSPIQSSISPLRTKYRRQRISTRDEELNSSFLHQHSQNSATIDHLRTHPLDANVRVGFSLLNLTGQPLRYLQHWEGGRKTVQYLNDGERGLVNFVAAQTLIRNNKIAEETFDVQQEKHEGVRLRHRKIVGNRVALQVAGYRWLHSVQADDLGVQYEDLFPVLGRVNATRVYKNRRLTDALKLMAEVLPYCGGRMLRLRSMFCVKNETKHRLSILAKEGTSLSEEANHSDERVRDIPFQIETGESLYIPLALLYRSIIASHGNSLGLLYIRPSDILPVEEELSSRMDLVPGYVEFSTDPINIFQIVTSSAADGNLTADERRESSESYVGSDYEQNESMQVCCHVVPKSRIKKGNRLDAKNKSNSSDRRSIEEVDAISPESSLAAKLPPFCYSIEIINGVGSSDSSQASKRAVGDNHDQSIPTMPLHYTIAIHPPIVIENLLPSSGVFELVHATQKRILWSSCITPGMTKSVHTVTLDEPLLLLINLRYCRAPEGVLVHEPKRQKSNKRNGARNFLQGAIEGFLEEEEEVSSVTLSDTAGQKLRLNVENIEGGGGQRHITVYCPYWIVNTSQFSFRIREEGDMELPAGTVTAQKDGTRPVPLSSTGFDTPDPVHNVFDSNRVLRGDHLDSPSRAARSLASKVFSPVFPGCCGPLHLASQKEIPLESNLVSLLNRLSFSDLISLAYMFNFKEDSNILNSGKRVKLQLDDSDWSSSLSLDSVGVNQGMAIEHSSRGILEVGLRIDVAPGRLSKYTKIVRLLPRFTVVNRLPMNLKIVQPNGLGDESSDVDVLAGHLRPYHLPGMYGERIIAVQLEGSWRKTVAFSLDHIGSFTLEAKRHLDLASIPHVNTRGAPEYTVEIPKSKVVGITFETDWGEENIVVKSLQPGCFAARETEIRVGDVLIAIDNESFTGQTFELAMNILKHKVANHGCLIKIRTVEEKLRLIRESALSVSRKVTNDKHKSKLTPMTPRVSSVASPMPNTVESYNMEDTLDASSASYPGSIAMRVEMKHVDSCVAVVISELNESLNTEYRIENRSVCYKLHYKQKGISGNFWLTLSPGQIRPYIWEDPFKPHKLLVHVGDNVLCPSDHINRSTLNEKGELSERGRGDDTLGTYLSLVAGVSTESATVLDLDKIGSTQHLPLYKPDNKLIASVKSEGPTKVLVISPATDRNELIKEFRYSISFQEYQIVVLRKLSKDIYDLIDQTQASLSKSVRVTAESFSTVIAKQFYDSIRAINDKQRELLEQTSLEKQLELISVPNIDDEDNRQSKSIIELVSLKSFDRLYDAGIDHPNQLVLDLYEARDISPTVVGKVEDIYCKIYLKTVDKTING